MACRSWGNLQTKLSVKPELCKYKTNFDKAENPNFCKPLLTDDYICYCILIFKFSKISFKFYNFFFSFTFIHNFLFLVSSKFSFALSLFQKTLVIYNFFKVKFCVFVFPQNFLIFDFSKVQFFGFVFHKAF